MTERPKRFGKVSASHRRRDRWWREAWRSIDRRCDFPSFFTPDQRHPPSRTLSLSPSSRSRPPPPFLPIHRSVALSVDPPSPSWLSALALLLSPPRLYLLRMPLANGIHPPADPRVSPFFPFSPRCSTVFPLLTKNESTKIKINIQKEYSSLQISYLYLFIEAVFESLSRSAVGAISI